MLMMSPCSRLFLTEGLLTLVVGVVVYFFLPDCMFQARDIPQPHCN